MYCGLSSEDYQLHIAWALKTFSSCFFKILNVSVLFALLKSYIGKQN